MEEDEKNWEEGIGIWEWEGKEEGMEKDIVMEWEGDVKKMEKIEEVDIMRK